MPAIAYQPAAILPIASPPKYWSKRVSAAYLRMMGLTQAAAAKAVGRAARTIRTWESEPSWVHAREEARHLWMNDLEDASRKTLLSSVRDGDGDLALKVLERLDELLRPPTQRVAPTDPSGEQPYAMNLAGLSNADLETLESILRRASAVDPPDA